ncbi:transposase [Streptomyces sp. NBC_01358]|uniref:transposase n=1 Tax=Streptomyces sp. NBC_01358 TaxID=2903837 RepID=UPI002E301064|nr:transposase [Streptomyces sp. NBC_01358]
MGIIDARSVRASASVTLSSSGHDGGRKVPGRKRHIVTDTLGLLLVVAVTAANVGDRDAAVPLLQRLHTLHRETTLVWADGGYTGGLIGWAREKLTLALQVVERTDTSHRFPGWCGVSGGAASHLCGCLGRWTRSLLLILAPGDRSVVAGQLPGKQRNDTTGSARRTRLSG